MTEITVREEDNAKCVRLRNLAMARQEAYGGCPLFCLRLEERPENIRDLRNKSF